MPHSLCIPPTSFHLQAVQFTHFISACLPTDNRTEFVDVHQRVLDFSISSSRLVVATVARCLVVSPATGATMHSMETPAPIVLIRQAARWAWKGG